MSKNKNADRLDKEMIAADMLYELGSREDKPRLFLRSLAANLRYYRLILANYEKARNGTNLTYLHASVKYMAGQVDGARQMKQKMEEGRG